MEINKSHLVTIVAAPGVGKSTLLARLLEGRGLRGIFVGLAGGVDLSRSPQVLPFFPPVSPEGARGLAKAGCALLPGEWLIVDDAESYLDPWLSRRNPFRTFIQYRRNLGVNVALSMKDTLDVPRQVRTNTTWWIANPLALDPDIVRWLSRAGLPSDPLPELSFWSGPRGGPFQKSAANRLDFGAITS